MPVFVAARAGRIPKTAAAQGKRHNISSLYFKESGNKFVRLSLLTPRWADMFRVWQFQNPPGEAWGAPRPASREPLSGYSPPAARNFESPRRAEYRGTCR